MHEKINVYLSEMQAESPNCGGKYHFTKLELPEGQDLAARLKKYLLTIPAYQNPFVESGNERISVQDRQVENLRLSPVPGFENALDTLLKYWREHRTGLDCREDLSDQYFAKELIFKSSVINFISNLNDLTIYKLEGIDTYFAHEIGGDMVGDEFLLESLEGNFALHFGWSS